MTILGNAVFESGISTNSVTYTDSGFSTTFTPDSGGKVLIRWGCTMQLTSTASELGAFITPVFSGGNTLAAADANAIFANESNTTTGQSASVTYEQLFTGLASSSTTLKFSVKTQGAGEHYAFTSIWATIYSA